MSSEHLKKIFFNEDESLYGEYTSDLQSDTPSFVPFYPDKVICIDKGKSTQTGKIKVAEKDSRKNTTTIHSKENFRNV